MTFNTWHSGAEVTDGLEKIAKHLINETVDIVALQEFRKADLNQLTLYLNKSEGNWSHGDIGTLLYETVVFSRFPIKISNITFNAKLTRIVRTEVEIGLNNSIIVWGAHLNYKNYGPYIACNPLFNANMSRAIHTSGMQRSRELIAMRQEPQFQRDLDSHLPMIVLGDFNEPSHLDWVSQCKKLHCGKVMKWGGSDYLSSFGFVDAFRRVYPDPAKNPGATWSPIYSESKPYKEGHEIPYQDTKLPEPRDRIDFIYFRKGTLKPFACKTFTGIGKLRNFKPEEAKKSYKENNWPSDHGSVICDFHFL